MLDPMVDRPQTHWFERQALECIALALRAKDPRVKRLYALEAERWLRLAELKENGVTRYGGANSNGMPTCRAKDDVAASKSEGSGYLA